MMVPLVSHGDESVTTGEQKTQKLSFNDTKDIFTICQRDLIAAIKSLWRNAQLFPKWSMLAAIFFLMRHKKIGYFLRYGQGNGDMCFR